MSVIEAATAGFKDMADGTVRFFFDVEPRHAGAALELFRARGTPAALAALQVGYAQAANTSPEPVNKAPEIERVEKPKVTQQAQSPEPIATKEPLGPLAYWLVLRCNEPEFWEWLGSLGYFCPDAKAAGSIVKEILDLKSRKDLDADPEKVNWFHGNIRGPYSRWCAARGVTA